MLRRLSSCNSTYRLRYWNVNRSSCYGYDHRYPVATVLTVYGIETIKILLTIDSSNKARLQQYLPFTVLKPFHFFRFAERITFSMLQQYLPFTVLKQSYLRLQRWILFLLVATVLTVYGIETGVGSRIFSWFCHDELQQYLPFTVLKLLLHIVINVYSNSWVATVLTVYGIETGLKQPLSL